MKKIFILLAAMMILPLANAARFEEDVHYEVIAEQATAKPELAEYFSYYCPHCNTLEPIIMNVINRLEGSDIKVSKNHVSFIGRNMGVEMQKAFAAAELLKVEEKITPIIFSAIHSQKRNIATPNDIRNIFIDAGIDGKKFDAALSSFMVNGMVSRMNKNTQDMKIRGVPAVIVNGKYQINIGSLKASGEELNVKLTQLIKFLANKTN